MKNGTYSPSYCGAQTEDLSVGCNFATGNWDSHQAHIDIHDNPEIFPVLQAAFMPSVFMPPAITMYHVTFSDDLEKGFAQPFTQLEVTKLDVQPPFPKNRKGVKAILSGIASKIGDQFVFGPAYDDENKYDLWTDISRGILEGFFGQSTDCTNQGVIRPDREGL